MIREDIWQGKRVFLTGHTGFKGSWLSLWLHKLGAECRGFSLPAPTEPALFEVARVAETIEHLQGDVRDFEAVAQAMAQQQPEVVFHLAAQPLVRLSYQEPIETYATNVMGTAHVLEACRRTESVRAVVIVTTDKCYENREWEWGYRENEPMGGHDPYSNSKGCAELVTAAYRASFFAPGAKDRRKVNVASGRAGNVVGGGDWALDRLVPDIVRSFSVGKPVVLRSPRATRPWQHVLEPLDGYLTLAERLLGSDGERFSEGWNFGPHGTAPVEKVVEHMKNSWGGEASWQLDTQASPHEAHLLKLDISKAAAHLKWVPKLDLESTLDWVVEWYRAYYNGGQDMTALTIQQIEAYQSLSPSL